MTRGIFISFEGLDGAGKTTQAALLADALRKSKQVEVLETREPGGTPIGEKIRDMALNTPGLDSMTETMLILAARREHILRHIEPALTRGTWVICDRFSDSTYAYQGGGRGVCLEWLHACLNEVENGTNPDISFYLEAPPNTHLSCGDIFETAGKVFYDGVRKMYQKIVADNPNRIISIAWRDENGNRREKTAIATQISAAVQARFPR